jgi:hypothetical protein
MNRLTTLILGLLLAGCVTQSSPATEAVGDAGPTTITQTHQTPDRPRLDFLLVVDNSGSMCEEQGRLAEAVPGLLEQWSDTDLRVAVISTDMQDPTHAGRFLAQPAPPVEAANCATGAPQTADCPDDLSTILSAADAAHCAGDAECVTAELSHRLACMVQLGTSGDGFEQGLEALRTATDCRGPNAEHFAACCVDGQFDPTCDAKVDFLRPNAALIVVIVSDEDDCSDTADNPVSRSANSNCEWQRDRLVPVVDYARHLMQLKAKPSEQLGVIAVVGEQAFDTEGNAVRYQAPTDAQGHCLDAQRTYQPELDLDGTCCLDGVCPGQIQTTCESDLGSAFAGHRYLELSSTIWPNPADQSSICGADWGSELAYFRASACDCTYYYCLDHPLADEAQPTVTARINGELLEGPQYATRPDARCAGGYRVEFFSEPARDSTITLEYVSRG